MLGANDAHTGDPFARLGPRGTVAQLLDAAVSRVPIAFPDDPRVRARLYTAIGSSLITQSRMRLASTLLDSARGLARASYGPRSDAFAEASLDAGNAALHRTTPAVAERLMRDALGAIAGRERAVPELHARILVGLATVALMDGRLRAMDSLARAAAAMELRRTRAPTLTRAWSERLLATASTMLAFDARATDAHFAHAVALTDSLGMTVSLERLDALYGRVYALSDLGRVPEATAIAQQGLAAAHAGFGPTSREAALFLAPLADLVRATGDSARATALADSASRIVDSIPDVNAAIALVGGLATIGDRLAHHRLADAQAIGDATLRRVESLGSAPATLNAALMVGLVHVVAGDPEGGRARFDLATEMAVQRPDLGLYLLRGFVTWGQSAAAQRLASRLPPADTARARVIMTPHPRGTR